MSVAALGHRPPAHKRSRLCRALRLLPSHCEASDPVWEAYFEASASRSPAARWMLIPVLRAAQAAAILPPPPGRLRALQALAAMLAAWYASFAAHSLFVQHIEEVLEEGFQLALHAYVVENFIETIQPPIILLVTWCNLGRTAPTLAAVMAPTGPLRPSSSFIALTGLLYVAHGTSQVLFHVGVFKHRGDYIYVTMAAAWSGFMALITDRLVALVLTFAALKIQVVNQKLSALPTTTMSPSASPSRSFFVSTSATWLAPEPPIDTAVQRGLLQTVANRWESTMEQVSSLLGLGMLGLPLLYSLLHMSIGLVTATTLALRDTTEPTIRYIKLIDVAIYLARVASLALTAGWLYREAKETEAIIGALDTSRWPIRERQRVNHLLHLSRAVARFRVCGIISLDHRFLFTVMGNTVTYLVMLLQYPILTPTKAAAILNQTDPN